MSNQAKQLQQTMAFFKLDSSTQGQPVPLQLRKSHASTKVAKTAPASQPVVAHTHARVHAKTEDLDEAQFTKF
ncbi:MAG: hypothetical protein FD135_111 [Comamonadaceae bacterium]|nr:MAG: hypothetical protein FD135_111 [Comamonadaceae bacterium]